MTAFEAKKPQEMKFPARNIAWITTAIYILITLSFVLNVKWTDRSLPELYNQDLVSVVSRNLAPHPPPSPSNGTLDVLWTNSAPIIATIHAGIPFLPGFLTVCFIYSALSAANTALYVASRALFGLTRNISTERDSGLVVRALATLGTVESRTKSPWWAVIISMLLFFWLPFLHLSDGLTKKEVRTAPPR